MKSFIRDASWWFFPSLVALIDSVDIVRLLALFLHQSVPHLVLETHHSLGLSTAECCSTSTVHKGNSCALVVMKACISLYGSWKWLLFGTRMYLIEKRCLIVTLLVHCNKKFSKASVLLTLCLCHKSRIAENPVLLLLWSCPLRKNKQTNKKKPKKKSRLFFCPTPDSELSAMLLAGDEKKTESALLKNQIWL